MAPAPCADARASGASSFWRRVRAVLSSSSSGSRRWLGSPSCSRLLLTDPAAAEQPFFFDQRALVRPLGHGVFDGVAR